MRPNVFSFREVADHIMDMRMQALRSWHPNKFVAFDVIDHKWSDADFDNGRIAQEVADTFLWKMVYGK